MAEEYHPISRPRGRHWANLGLVLLILIAVVVGSVLVAKHNKNKQAVNASGVRLVYFDSAKGLATLADNTGASLARANLTKNSYVSFEAVSPDGNALLTLNPPSPQESFALLGGTTKALPSATTTALRTADYQGGSHHFVFIDEQTVAFVTCASGSSCKLVNLDLSNGKSRTILDTGLSEQTYTSYCYLLGKSPDNKVVYLRVNGKNKIGSNNNAVYQLDASSGKNTKAINLPQTVGYSLSLSPNAKTLVYQTIMAVSKSSSQTALNIINVADGKQTTVKWSKVGISEQSGSLQWSPDSSKVVFRTGTIRFPVGSQITPVPIYLAYLNVAKQQVVDLQTVRQTDRNDIISNDWLDDSTIVYDQQTATNPTDFSAVKNQLYKQDVKNLAVTQFNGPQTNLLQANY